MATSRRFRLRVWPPSSARRTWEYSPEAFGSVEDISDALVCRENDRFLITDGNGDIPAGNRRGLGLYCRDTRHLSVYDLLIDGVRPLVLMSHADSAYSQEQVLGNYRTVHDEKVLGRATIQIVRRRVLGQHFEDSLTITNFNPFPVEIEPEFSFDADFADIFEVRGHRRSTPGERLTPDVEGRMVHYRYWGADGVWRSTTLVFEQKPDRLNARRAFFKVALGPRESKELRLRVFMNERPHAEARSPLPSLIDEYGRWRAGFARITTDNDVYNQVLERSVSDLRMLWSKDQNGNGYVAAGTPWFATFFGRDSIITSLQTLPFRKDIARNTLTILARLQGQSEDRFREEAPGKILHELREDELSVAGELPYQRYYGSVDSTPLFLVLVAEYFHWTGDAQFVQELMPAINLALRWPEHHGDLNSDGFIDYRTDSPGGLRNQGWKDSEDGVMHADGSLLDGPVALCEVQGYLYRAYQRLAPVFEVLGDGQHADQLRRKAEALKQRFNQKFWLQREKRVALALDGAGRPSSVLASNAGQVLWSRILGRARAAYVRDALMQPDMFSGWGIRTLSSKERNYHPLGYHVGTVWPHDNALIALGLKRYGFERDVIAIATGLFEAARHFPNYRLPELFGGQSRSEVQVPVPYPVACRPQAWTAGAQLHLLQAMLGLVADASNRFLWLVRPNLPPWLGELEIKGLRVGNGEADLHLQRRAGRTSVRFVARGDLNVAVSPSWQRFAD